MDRIDAMQAFVAVADLQGFAPAARKLGLSPSGVTRLIAALENRLGARLLQRTTRQVTLPMPARAIWSVRGGSWPMSRKRKARPRANRRGRAAGCWSPRRRIWAAARQPGRDGLSKRYPEVSVDLRLSDRMINLVEDGVDLAVRIGHLPDSTLVGRHVGEMRRIVVAAKEYLKRRGEPQRPADIAEHDTIQFGAMTATPDWRFIEDGRELPSPTCRAFRPTAPMPRSTTPRRAAG